MYRKDFALRMKTLKDREKILLICYAILAGWDKRYEGYGVVKKSMREIQREFLQDWNPSKISDVRKILVDKKFISLLGRSAIKVENYKLYRSEGIEAEQIFSLIEKGVNPTEQNVLDNERLKLENIQNSKAELIKRMRGLS